MVGGKEQDREQDENYHHHFVVSLWFCILSSWPRADTISGSLIIQSEQLSIQLLQSRSSTGVQHWEFKAI